MWDLSCVWHLSLIVGKTKFFLKEASGGKAHGLFCQMGWKITEVAHPVHFILWSCNLSKMI